MGFRIQGLGPFFGLRLGLRGLRKLGFRLPDTV